MNIIMHIEMASFLKPRRRRIFLFLLIIVIFCIIYYNKQLKSLEIPIPSAESIVALKNEVYGRWIEREPSCGEEGPFLYELSVLAVFKDAAIYLEEWIEFHLLVGFDHFYLYNNNSTDQYLKVLKPYMEQGIVDLVQFPTKFSKDVYGRKIIATQKAALIDGIPLHWCETKWLAVFDIDEFFFPTSPTLSLKQMLHFYLDTNSAHSAQERELEASRRREELRSNPIFAEMLAASSDVKCGGVGAWRLNFGSSGHKVRPDGLVLENYTKRTPIPFTGKKIIFNPRLMQGLFNTHWFFFKDDYELCDESRTPLSWSVFRDNENLITRTVKHLRINHYYTKSFQDWGERLTRGTISGRNEEFNWEMFKEGDAANTFQDEMIMRYLPDLKERIAAKKLKR